MKTTNHIRTPLAAALAVAALITSAHADTIIPLTNGDFEVGADNQPMSGWSGGGIWSFNHAALPKPGNDSLGARFAYITKVPGPAFGSQTVSVAYLANQVYTFQGFTVDSGGGGNNISFELGYDPGSGFVSLAVASFDESAYAGWTLVDGVDYQTPSSGGPVGENIIVRVRNEHNLSNAGVWVDNVSLSYAASGYSSWATLNGASANLNDDHDSDGVSNGIEYFIGGPAGNTTGFTPLPGVTNTDGTLSVTWTMGSGYAGAYPADFVVETSATLDAASWTPAATSGTPATANTVYINGTTVIYTFPVGTPNFARLKVTGP